MRQEATGGEGQVRGVWQVLFCTLLGDNGKRLYSNNRAEGKIF
jgi:hypothetical protein